MVKSWPQTSFSSMSPWRNSAGGSVPRIVNEFPSTRVLILSGYANEEYVLRALRGGAAGYLLKTPPPRSWSWPLKPWRKTRRT